MMGMSNIKKIYVWLDKLLLLSLNDHHRLLRRFPV